MSESSETLGFTINCGYFNKEYYFIFIKKVKKGIYWLGELKDLWKIIKQLDRKVIIIFISVAILQTISYYYTSRRFFRYNYFEQFQFDKNVFLYEYIYWFVGDFLTLFILPLLIIKLLLKGKLTGYGIKDRGL